MSLEDCLNKLWPHGDQHVPGLRAGIAKSAPAVFTKYGINSPLVIAHMMGQFSHECGAGLEMVENLNYSSAGLLKTWPKHFSRFTAWRYAHNPRMIAIIAYGGRMGNAPSPSDDGWQFKGQGLSQLTGRENYTKLHQITGLDVLTHPELLVAPDTALECGVADYVKMCGCLPFAQADDVHNETLHLNGGLIGLPMRITWIAQWKQALGV